MRKPQLLAILFLSLLTSAFIAQTQAHVVVLHAARLFDVDTGKIVTPGEVLVEGERIVAAERALRIQWERKPSTWATRR